MPDLIHEFITRGAEVSPRATALVLRDQSLDYTALRRGVECFACGLMGLELAPGDRVAVYLQKQFETVFGLFGAAQAGACFVPLNPILKARQLAHILPHCGARVLLTSWQRLELLEQVLPHCPDLETLVLVDEAPAQLPFNPPQQLVSYADFAADNERTFHSRIDTDMVAILYTSGSTGLSKGVVLSHRNLVAGAESVVSYLQNTDTDRLLALLPLSFDAGLSQLTTAFAAGAAAVLLDYLMPKDVIRAITRHGVTGLTAVPPLYNQLRDLVWPDEARQSLRYIASTGGAMPLATIQALQKALPESDIFLMYGLTEAFRSTFLPPEQVTVRPESIGKAIPNAQVLVVNQNGEECEAQEEGELVHRGALVSKGYWQEPELTAARFRPAPLQPKGVSAGELAVWSGDRVYKDEEGYLYFVGRADELIKTSGYRVSPTEIEDVVLNMPSVQQAAAVGLPHDQLGQAILLIVARKGQAESGGDLSADILQLCRAELPNFMVPQAIVELTDIPRNDNGKLDRTLLRDRYQDYFAGDNAQ